MESRPLPPDWTSQYDDREQRLFFTNTLTQYRTWEDPRPAFYAQKEQGYQQGYPSHPPPAPHQHQDYGTPSHQNQSNVPQNMSDPPPANNSYTNSGYSGYSEETIYVQKQEEEEKHSSGLGVGSAVAMAAGVGLLGAVAGGMIANHQNHKQDEKHHKNNTGKHY
ncbi:hypothetical protein BDF19DRAFT_435825 [Syncephalis fuscata]|nr:hypothetical protein BDF19DRAFT_435825 [Syncephalis fuscata]